MEYSGKKEELANQPEVKRVSYASLREALASIPDPRRQNGNKIYRLEARLLAVVAGLLSGQLNVLACAEWLKEQELSFKPKLGFADEITPPQTTFQRLLSKLPSHTLEQALTGYFEGQLVEQ